MAEEDRDKSKHPYGPTPAFQLLVDFARERGIIEKNDSKPKKDSI